MTHPIRTILLFLLLGAFVNIAVAWSLKLSEMRLARSRQANAALQQKVNPWASTFVVEPCLSPLRNTAGWPMIGFSSSAVVVMPPIAGQVEPVVSISLSEGLVFRTLPRPFDWLSQHALPLRPELPGFIINTLFFAALCWYAIAGQRQVRSWRRRRRGICASCGYDLRGAPHTLCPECGAAVHQPL